MIVETAAEVDQLWKRDSSERKGPLKRQKVGRWFPSEVVRREKERERAGRGVGSVADAGVVLLCPGVAGAVSFTRPVLS